MDAEDKDFDEKTLTTLTKAFLARLVLVSEEEELLVTNAEALLGVEERKRTFQGFLDDDDGDDDDDDDDDGGKNTIKTNTNDVLAANIRFVETSRKQTPVARRIDCKKATKTTKKKKDDDFDDDFDDDDETRKKTGKAVQEELSVMERCAFAKHYVANACVANDAKCWFETTIESFHDARGGKHDYIGWARKDAELSEKNGIAEFCEVNKGKCSSVRAWNDDWVFRGKDRAFERKERKDVAEERGVFDVEEKKGKKKKGQKTTTPTEAKRHRGKTTKKKKKKEFEEKNYVPLYASDTNRNVFAVGSIVLSTIAFEKTYIEFRYYVDGVLYKIDRIKRDVRDNNDDNAWWFPVTSHSSAMNDVTFNFGTYPMFRNMCEKAREVNEGFLARAKKIYGDDDDDHDDHDDHDDINKDLFTCLHAPFTRSLLHVDVSRSNSENSKNEAYVEDELRRVFLRPIKKLVSAISTNECPITNKKDIHILFWQLLRTYFDSTFRMDKFLSSNCYNDRDVNMDDDGGGGDDDTSGAKAFYSPWKVDATKAKRECFALCRLLVAHDPHVVEYQHHHHHHEEEEEEEEALFLSNDEFDVFCEMLKDDGNVVMGSDIYGPRMLDWWFPRCVFECLSFMASRELFCGTEEDLTTPHPLERAAKLLRATEEGNFRILSHQSWGANFTRLFATRELSGALLDLNLSAESSCRMEESDDEGCAEFSEHQKTRLNRLKIYIERREQCKASFVFAAMTTSLRNVPERAVEPNIKEDKSREYFRAPQTAERPGALEAIKCPIDWEASENITSNDGSAFDAYEYEGSDRMIEQFERTDRIIDDRAEKKFERNDHFTSDSIEANTWAFEPINTGFFRDRTVELANTTGDTINNLHGLDSNKFGTTPLDFWMQETTRWAYDRYEPFARDPHAELKGTRVGLAARHLVDTLSRLLADELEQPNLDQFTVHKASFFHYYVANPWHMPKRDDRPLPELDGEELGAMAEQPRNDPEYWCCPMTPLQHYVPGYLKRNRWMRNCDYRRTRRERRAHANIQYDLTNGFDAELLGAAQFLPQFKLDEYWKWNILNHETVARTWSESLFERYSIQTRRLESLTEEITDRLVVEGSFNEPEECQEDMNYKNARTTRYEAKKMEILEENTKKRRQDDTPEHIYAHLRWSPFPCDGIMLEHPTNINAHVRDRYSYVRDKNDPRNELSFGEFFKYKAGDSLRQPYKNASEHIAQILMGMSHLSMFLVEPGERRPSRQAFLREFNNEHDIEHTKFDVLRSTYDKIASNNEHSERARLKVASYCSKMIVTNMIITYQHETYPNPIKASPEEEWKFPIVPMAMVNFIFNTWRDHFENEKYIFDRECKFVYVLLLYCSSMEFENPGARDVCRDHVEFAFKFPLVKKFAFQTKIMSRWYMVWCAKNTVEMEEELHPSKEEELQKDISFGMRILSNASEGLGLFPVDGHLKLLMRKYLEYLAKDLGELNKGLTDCMSKLSDQNVLVPGYEPTALTPKHIKTFRMLYERIVERLECVVAKLPSRCRGNSDVKDFMFDPELMDQQDFMFDPELMDQLAEIIAYIGKHFHLSGRKGMETPFEVFIKNSGSNDLVCEELNAILFIDPGGFLNPVVEILCRMTESRLPDEDKKAKNDGNRQHFKCKVRGEFLDTLVRHVTKRDVENLSFYRHSTRFENRVLHAAALKALRMKLDDLEALEDNKNILPEMLDPITHSIMFDPVFVGETGSTSCDSLTLSRHFQKTGKRTDPFTGMPIVGEIRKNENLKERIKKFLEKENVMSTMGDVDVDVFMPDEAASMG